MKSSNFDEVLARLERRIEEVGLSEREASLRATGKPDMIRDMRRRHGLPNSQRLMQLAATLHTTTDWILNGGEQARGLVPSEVTDAGMKVGDVERAWRGERAAPAVPLVGSAIGGEWDGIDEAIELTELHLAQVLDYVARPPSLSGDKGAYAVTIVGDSMAPRFEPGERAYVSPRSPASIGDDVIVQLKACDGEDGDRITMVLIKRLVRRTAKTIELRQFNPDMTFKVPLERVAAVHRVVGRL